VVGTERGDKAPVALLARQGDSGGLAFAGSAMITLPNPVRDTFWQAMELLAAPSPPVGIAPRKGTSWVRPVLTVEVRTLKGEEMLRHATVIRIISLAD